MNRSFQNALEPLGLKLDPWSIAFRSGLQLEVLNEDEDHDNIDYFSETDVWKPVKTKNSTTAKPATLFFIDGVRRLDLKTASVIDGKIQNGGLGTIAAGGIKIGYLNKTVSNSFPISNLHLRRFVIVSDEIANSIDLKPDEKLVFSSEASSCKGDLTFEILRTYKQDSSEIIDTLQQKMRDIEAQIAFDISSTENDNSDYVILDGPLSNSLVEGQNDVVGYIKSIHNLLLSKEKLELLLQLKRGERTPIFQYDTKYGDDYISRYTWYLRLTDLQMMDSPLSNLARIEVPISTKIDKAVKIANELSDLLPRFSAERLKDSRAPQNLVPIKYLEQYLNKMMGNHTVIYRRLLSSFFGKSKMV